VTHSRADGALNSLSKQPCPETLARRLLSHIPPAGDDDFERFFIFMIEKIHARALVQERQDHVLAKIGVSERFVDVRIKYNFAFIVPSRQRSIALLCTKSGLQRRAFLLRRGPGIGENPIIRTACDAPRIRF
jgi:hypothetical protein